ncbi:hypothetical protein CDL15_Pgr012773 [Punica granatum]|uniref:Uncharacterized protein n=1 Tax=Punica granatum TaxID=22663 RepID=A0A218XG25_PUNGR|nr:hypothetical protein CDL15_Pgr012773 [Punica granatum]
MRGESNNDPIAIHSAIALLQERFRRLHKVKKMREKRELTRTFPVQPKVVMFKPRRPTTYDEHFPSWSSYFHRESSIPANHRHVVSFSSSCSPSTVPLSLWPHFRSNRDDKLQSNFNQLMETPVLRSSWPAEPGASAKDNYDADSPCHRGLCGNPDDPEDVDTSLHL